MKRNVYLSGELAQKYGDKLVLKANTMQEVFKILDANDSSFKKYLIDCDKKGIGFACQVEKEELDLQGCVLPLTTGDLYISPVPSGSKSGFGKILAAMALAALIIVNPGAAFIAASGSLTTTGLVVANIAVSLAMAGVQQMMAPDPATDEQAPNSYLFNGSQQNIKEGDPIPLLYGELRVPGKPVSFELRNSARSFSSGKVELHEVGSAYEYHGLFEEIMGEDNTVKLQQYDIKDLE